MEGEWKMEIEETNKESKKKKEEGKGGRER